MIGFTPIKSLGVHVKMTWFLRKQLIKASLTSEERSIEIESSSSLVRDLLRPTLFLAQCLERTLLLTQHALHVYTPLPVRPWPAISLLLVHSDHFYIVFMSGLLVCSNFPHLFPHGKFDLQMIRWGDDLKSTKVQSSKNNVIGRRSLYHSEHGKDGSTLKLFAQREK